MRTGCCGCRRMNATCLNGKNGAGNKLDVSVDLTILTILCTLIIAQAYANYRSLSLVLYEDHNDSGDDNSTVFKPNTINFLDSSIFFYLGAFQSPD